MPPGADAQWAGDRPLKYQSHMNGGQILQMLRTVVAGVPACAVILVGAQAILEERNRLPGKPARYFNSRTLECLADQFLGLASDGFELVGLRLLIMPIENDGRDGVPDFGYAEITLGDEFSGWRGEALKLNALGESRFGIGFAFAELAL